MTRVAIRGEDFLIDGRPTYAGRAWRGHRIEGLLHTVGLAESANIFPEGIVAHAGRAIRVETRPVILTQQLLRDRGPALLRPDRRPRGERTARERSAGRLPLAEREALARSRLAVLLAFLHA